MKNKKGNGASDLLIIFVMILVFALISLIAVTIGFFYFAIGNDYVVLPMYDVSQTFNSSTQFQNAYDNTVESYQGTDLSFIDNMWFFGYLVLVVISFTTAYKSRTTNYFSWLSMLTYGLMFVLFIVGLFSVVLTWWYNDILMQLFINLVVDTPKLEYFILNFGFIFLIHSAALLLVKVVDFDFSSRFGRKKKEMASLDDEVI